MFGSYQKLPWARCLVLLWFVRNIVYVVGAAFAFCFLWIVFLGKAQDVVGRLRFPRIPWRTFCAANQAPCVRLWLRRLRRRREANFPALLLLLLPLTHELFFFLALLLALCRLQLRQVGSLATELPLLDHLAHENPLSLNNTYLELHVVELCAELEGFQRYVLLG